MLFFFTWKWNPCVKPFFGVFSTFFTQENGFHAWFVSKFSRKETGFTHTFNYFFHALLKNFHVRKIENFHGRFIIFTQGFFWWYFPFIKCKSWHFRRSFKKVTQLAEDAENFKPKLKWNKVSSAIDFFSKNLAKWSNPDSRKVNKLYIIKPLQSTVAKYCS